MVNARQVARWIVDDIAGELNDRGLDWECAGPEERQVFINRWLDTAEEYVKKYPGLQAELEGKSIHHIGGDSGNNSPENLGLAEFTTEEQEINAMSPGCIRWPRTHRTKRGRTE
jgi:hypothetical protein